MEGQSNKNTDPSNLCRVNIHALKLSLDHSTYSYSLHTVSHVSPSSLCYPRPLQSIHPSNHIPVYLTFTSHWLHYHPSIYMACSFTPCFQIITTQSRLLYSPTLFHFNPSTHLFIPVYVNCIYTNNFSNIR